MTELTQEEVNQILINHRLWLTQRTGERADLRSANLWGANLRNANLRGADLRNANLWGANLEGADLRSANLWGANLRNANLWGANLEGANLEGADLRNANLGGADLRAFGDMVYLKTMQFDMWPIGYTYNTLQIGCQRHLIEHWEEWNTPEGRDWVDDMDDEALKWADKNLDLILSIIHNNPAKENKECLKETKDD